MAQFRKNAFRLSWKNKASFLGAVLIIAMGILSYVSMIDTLDNLHGQIYQYYSDSRLADVFAEVSGIPDAELEQLEEIPGIRTAFGRISEDVRILADGQDELVTVHLMSYDDGDELNLISLSGEDGPGYDEIFLGKRMEDFYHYGRGEEIRVLLGGESVRLFYAGYCYAPDYVYAMPPGGSVLPDGEVYDIACVSKSRIKELTGCGDMSNELGFQLEDGYSFEDVRYALQEKLENYGLLSLTKQADQASVGGVSEEVDQLDSIALVLLALFMAISVFMLYIVLKKMIDRDQSLIGTMKAMGMDNKELLGAYLLEGIVVGILGALLGSVLASPVGQFMFDLYIDYFTLPDTTYYDYMNTRLAGLAISVGTGVAAVFLGVRGITKIVPAQAMRARMPEQKGIVLRSSVRIPPLARLAVQAVLRNPFRGFLIVLSVAFPFSMSTVLFSFDSVVDKMYLEQFTKKQVYDIQASLDTVTGPVSAENAAMQVDGVEQAEGVNVLACEVRMDNRSEFSSFYGLHRGSGLWRIMDMDGVYHEPPEDGVIINWSVADKLHVKEGDRVEVCCPDISDHFVEIPVTKVLSETLGGGLYMDLDSMDRFFPVPVSVNTVVMSVEPGMLDTAKEKLMNASLVTWLADSEKIKAELKDSMDSMISMIYMFALMSVAVGAVLIYNVAMINIREREEEFGTIRVLGGSDREIFGMLALEMVIYFFLGIILGIPGCEGVKKLVQATIVSDSYRIRLSVTPAAYFLTFAVCIVIAALAVWQEMRFIRKIQLTDVLKARE